MTTSSNFKDEGFVGGKFLSVTPHKSFWPMNKNVVRARPELFPIWSNGERDWPVSSVSKTQGGQRWHRGHSASARVISQGL